MPTSDREDPYRQGHEAGGDMAMNAIDCPYLPPDPRRTAWMDGFSANRASVSPASDPDDGDDPDAGDGQVGTARHPLPPLHEG